MKRNLQIILAATTASFLTFTVVAQDIVTPKSDRPAHARDGVRQSQADRPHSAAKARDIIGMAVHNLQDEKLGSVEDLAVDLNSGRIIAVVVSTGGFLGMGDELSAVPPAALSFNAERDRLRLDASKEMLSAAPRFKPSQWPDFTQPAYSSSVNRAYKVEPYSATTPATEADNTARNVRDRDDRTLTPLDQGNSKGDTDTTAQIRKAVVDHKGMSVNAKNVKIITDKGRVTLRGPVQSEEEKRLIGDIANRIARTENVDNQLEVSLSTTRR